MVGGGSVLLAETKSKEAPATRRSLLCVKERMVPLEEIKIYLQAALIIKQENLRERPAVWTARKTRIGSVQGSGGREPVRGPGFHRSRCSPQ